MLSIQHRVIFRRLIFPLFILTTLLPCAVGVVSASTFAYGDERNIVAQLIADDDSSISDGVIQYDSSTNEMLAFRPIVTRVQLKPRRCNVEQARGQQPDKGLLISQVSWVQVVQQQADDRRTKVAANKNLYVRVDLTAPRDGMAMPLTAKLILSHRDGSACREYKLSSQATFVPLRLNSKTLDYSYTSVVPAADIKPGLVYQVVIDYYYASSDKAASRLYRQGVLNVSSEISDNIKLFYIRFNDKIGFLPSTNSVSQLIQRMMPHSSVIVSEAGTVEPDFLYNVNSKLKGHKYVFDLSVMSDLLAYMDDYCVDQSYQEQRIFGGSGKAYRCIVVYPENMAFQSSNGTSYFTGLGYIAGLTALTPSFAVTDSYSVTDPYKAPWISNPALTLLHEFGHLMGLRHANCGHPTGIDSRLYENGSLGDGGGYDFVRQLYFNGDAANSINDLMSYCGHRWISDKGYRAVINFKAPQAFAKDEVFLTQSVRFTQINGSWSARLIDRPDRLVPSSQLKDARLINERFSGLPLFIHATAIAESNFGPYYVELSSALVAELKAGSINGVILKSTPASALR